MTSTTPGAHLLGSLHRTTDGRGAVRMEDLYDTDIDNLWSALTDPRRLASWIAEVQGALNIGGTIQVRFTSGWDGPGRIDVCQPPHRLTVTMTPGTPDETVIDAILTPENDKTRLVIEERGIPLKELPYHGAGWQAHVEDLTAHITGKPAASWKQRWTALTPTYQNLDIRTA